MDPLATGLAKAGVPFAQRHLFVCLGPDCANFGEGQALWDHMKSRIQKLDLPIMRTKALCFRICTQGPILLIYPDGIWYGNVTPARFDRIVKEHVIGNQPIQDWILVRNALCPLSTA